MPSREEEFLERLRATFRIEAKDHLEALAKGLEGWAGGTVPPQPESSVETMFRETHSLKGAARAVNLKDVEALCQPLEDAFSGWKKKNAAAPRGAFVELLVEFVQTLSDLSEDLASGKTVERKKVDSLISRLPAATRSAWDESTPVVQPVSPEALPSVDQETVRVAAKTLTPLLLQAEELIQVKQAAGERLTEWKRLQDQFERGESAGLFTRTLRAAEQDFRLMKRLVDEHLDAAKKLLVLPVRLLVEGFPRLVRDLAAELKKEVRLVVVGSELEIDKRLLEELKSPLVHLLRNAVHHGIEGPEARVSKGKPRHGTVSLSFALVDGRRWGIEISDDGAGMDLEKLVAEATQAGHLPLEDSSKLDVAQKSGLAFLSGVSTAPVSEVSGRGLGLAIVREKVERLGGTVSVLSNSGGGTTFKLLLPLTLSTLRGIETRAGEGMFIFPSASVRAVVKVSSAHRDKAADRPTLRFRGAVLTLVSLRTVLGLPDSPMQVEAPFAVVLAETDIAFLVDEILEEQELLVKPLGQPLSRVRHFAGATILGAGKVVPILHVQDLVKSALKSQAEPLKPSKKTASPFHVLVADDSITTRTLIKGLLETAGYQVSTAVDGSDAWGQFQGGSFDLVVSDVDMPRSSGIELTERIRASTKGDVPVILVTSMDSPSDRARGFEAGADAYLGKGLFDQDSLLGFVKTLAEKRGTPQ